MEALNFLRFWKPTTTFPTPIVEVVNEVDEEEEGEDSFFDLELTAPDIDNKKNDISGEKDQYPDEKTTKETKNVELNEEISRVPAKTTSSRELCYPRPALSVSPIDPISKRRILPLEPINPKPQSPIALLKSAPTFRVFMFKKSSKSRVTEKTERKGETESCSGFMENQKQRRQEGKLFTVKFNVEEAPTVSKLTRERSSRRTGATQQQNQSPEDSKTERFSKDVIQKYLKLVKPLYVKVSKRYNEKMNSSASDIFMASPSSSPAVAASSMRSPKDRPGNIPAGIRTVCKHLGKSKSSSSSAAANAAPPPANRRDDSLLQQHDGIQSAILHCKRSFNSSRDSFSLSRSTSDSSSMKSCSSDSYRLSHSASETSHDNSARNSIEDGRGI